MAFYIAKERHADVTGSYRRYQEYLREQQQRFPAGAFALGTAGWWQDASDHRSPHDAWLESVTFLEPASGEHPAARAACEAAAPPQLPSSKISMFGHIVSAATSLTWLCFASLGCPEPKNRSNFHPVVEHPEDNSSPTEQFPPSGSKDAAFATTHWSVVLTAGNSDLSGAATALEQLCTRYWYPIYAFVRRRGFSAHEAEDLTQGFFARLLEKETLKRADRERGKFRTFLLVALTSFLNNEWDKLQALKRGGQLQIISLDETVAEERYRHEPVELAMPADFRFLLSPFLLFPVLSG